MADSPYAELTQTQEDFAEWMSYSKRERQLAKMPVTYTDFARDNKMTDRTLHRWRKDAEYPQVQRAIEEAKRRREEAKPITPAAATEQAATTASAKKRAARPALHFEIADAAEAAGLDNDAARHETLKNAIYQRALEGDKDSLTKWWALWGRMYAEADAKRLDSSFPGMSDSELASTVLHLLGADVVRQWLAQVDA